MKFLKSQMPRLVYFFFINLLIALITFEFGLYVLDYPLHWSKDNLSFFGSYTLADNKYGWKLKPGKYDLVSVDTKRTINFSVNEDGFRESSEKAQNNEKNILIAGDSYVMGYGLSDTETLPWLLQNKSNNYKVKNLGIVGYGTCLVDNQITNLISEKFINNGDHVFYIFNYFHESRNYYNKLYTEISNSKRTNISQFKFCKANIINEKLDISLYYVDLLPSLIDYSRTYNLLKKLASIIEFKYNKKYYEQLNMQILNDINLKLQNNNSIFTIVLFETEDKSINTYKSFFNQNNINFIDCSHIPKLFNSERLEDGHPNQKMNLELSKCIKEHFN